MHKKLSIMLFVLMYFFLLNPYPYYIQLEQLLKRITIIKCLHSQNVFKVFLQYMVYGIQN